MSTTQVREELSALKITRGRGGRKGGNFFWVVAILGVLGIAGYLTNSKRMNPPMTVKTESVRIMTMGQAKTVLTATGYLEARHQAAVGSKAAGRIESVKFEEGNKVAQGDVLAVLEHNDQSANLEWRKVGVARAKAELNEAQQQLKRREKDFKRANVIHNKNAGSQEALDLAEAEFHAQEARVDALTASVAAAEASVVEAEKYVENMIIRAPFGGTVIAREAEPGETIMPGGMGLASGRGSVVTLADLDDLEVDTDVKEDYLGKLEAGQPAEVVVDAVEEKRYKARLRMVIPMGDRARGVVKVKVSILNPDEKLFPELSATVHFLPKSAESIVGNTVKQTFIPKSAIVEDGENKFVWRLNVDRVERVDIKVKEEATDSLVVVEGDLTGEQVLVVDPDAELSPEKKVQVEQ